MTPVELLVKCEQQLAIAGPQAEISLVLPGSYGSGRIALCKGGPIGKIVSENPDATVLAFFGAQEVKTFVWTIISPST